MFEKLYQKLDDNNLKPTLKNVFMILDKNPAITKINSKVSNKYQTDKNLINRLKKSTKIVI